MNVHTLLRTLPALLLCAATSLRAAESADALKASASTPAPADYRPSVPDMMNIAIQPRHAKLGIAGHERNWKYAMYQLRDLRGAFNRIARTAPAHEGWDLQAMFNAMIMAPLKAVEDAIKAEDARAFGRTYQALTHACNGCHVAMGRDYIVIQVPRGTAYPNQQFRAPR